MKRNMELIRRMLLTIEERYDPQDDSREVYSLIYKVEGDYSESEIDYNFILLIEEGLVKGNYQGTPGGPFFSYVEGLTWAGHDFLDAIRQDVVWQGIQDKAKQAGLNFLSLSFEVLNKLAVSVAHERLGL